MKLDTAVQTLNVRTYDEALRKFHQQVSRRGLRRSQGAEPLTARVDHNRWIADCPCGAGVACDPEWPLALCYDCGTMHPIAWPSRERQESIEHHLLVRPLKSNRHWDGRESDAVLKAENALRGIKESN